MDPDKRAASPANDIAYGWFYSAAIGGSVVALFFLVLDAMAGRPLFTPTLLGSALFLGASAPEVETVNLAAVAYFTLAHFAAFGALGLLGTLLFRATLRHDAAPTLTAGVVLFLVMQGGWLLAGRTFFAGVLDVLGSGAVLAANALTAVAMALFLRYALGPEHEGIAESERELVEGPTPG